MVAIEVLKFAATLVLVLLGFRLIEVKWPESSLSRGLAFLH